MITACEGQMHRDIVQGQGQLHWDIEQGHGYLSSHQYNPRTRQYNLICRD